MKSLKIDQRYLTRTLLSLLKIPSPAGYTDQIVHFVGEELSALDVAYTITRRGAIRATVPGEVNSVSRALAVHLDTLGAMVNDLKANGRLGILPVGTWSCRFAEGARVTIFTDNGPIRGTVLPLKASGHTYGEEIDHQPTSWENLEVRVDCRSYRQKDLIRTGFNIGDFIAFDPSPEVTTEGYINSRHLDDKAGVAIVLAVLKAIRTQKVKLPVTCNFLFTIAEEVGLGASAVLGENVAEMVVIDNATIAPNQNSWEHGVTICMMDQSGPFDYHLTRKMISLCREYNLEYSRDVFRHYRSDCASAIVAGNDTRTALLGFALDSSHGYERTHIDSLMALATLAKGYIQTPLVFDRDKNGLSSLNGFPTQPEREIIQIRT